MPAPRQTSPRNSPHPGALGPLLVTLSQIPGRSRRLNRDESLKDKSLRGRSQFFGEEGLAEVVQADFDDTLPFPFLRKDEDPLLPFCVLC